MIALLARALAIAIAIGAVIDPALSSDRRPRPLVAIVSPDPVRDAALVRRTRAVLARDFELTGVASAAGAVVVAGDRLGAGVAPDQRVFAVLPDSAARGLAVRAFDYPASLHVGSAARVRVRLQVPVDTAVTVTVADAGTVQGRAVVTSTSGMVDTVLTFIPSGTGASRIDVTASTSRDSVRLSGAVSVRDEPWRLLFHDSRPSWMSTFVRREVEQDGRFAVASRIVTSRGIASSAGSPPADLTDAGRLAAFHAIVIGAPAGLTPRDVDGLETYLRRRGGTVVLLLDESARGPVDRLLRVTAWRTARLGAPAMVVPDEGPGLRASALAWPAVLPPGAEAIATADTTGGEAGRVVLWSAPVGAGRLVVSGALDAWHFRDASQSGFGAFWRERLDAASASSIDALGVRPTRPVLAVGDTASIEVTVRDVTLAARAVDARFETSLTGWARSGSDSLPLAFWPGIDPGVLEARFRAPSRPGIWQVMVSDGRHQAAATIAVVQGASEPGLPEPGLVRAVAAASGGAALHAAHVDALPGRMLALLGAQSHVVRWYPMRSPWWIVPFALLLGYEWWRRRRRGAA